MSIPSDNRPHCDVCGQLLSRMDDTLVCDHCCTCGHVDSTPECDGCNGTFTRDALTPTSGDWWLCDKCLDATLRTLPPDASSPIDTGDIPF